MAAEASILAQKMRNLKVEAAVSVKSPPWLFGPISRAEADSLLQKHGSVLPGWKPRLSLFQVMFKIEVFYSFNLTRCRMTNGLFLVRAKDARSYALSMAADGQFVHHLIERVDGGVLLVNSQRTFGDVTDLAALIQFMRTPRLVRACWTTFNVYFSLSLSDSLSPLGISDVFFLAFQLSSVLSPMNWSWSSGLCVISLTPPPLPPPARVGWPNALIKPITVAASRSSAVDDSEYDLLWEAKTDDLYILHEPKAAPPPRPGSIRLGHAMTGPGRDGTYAELPNGRLPASAEPESGTYLHVLADVRPLVF